MKESEIFITGATGFIGRHLVNRLIEKGERIRILTRNPDKVLSKWQDRLSISIGDLLDTKLKLPNDTTVVFHCAAEIKDESRFEKVNVEGTKNIVRACLEHSRCRLIHLSSVGVIGAELTEPSRKERQFFINEEM